MSGASFDVHPIVESSIAPLLPGSINMIDAIRNERKNQNQTRTERTFFMLKICVLVCNLVIVYYLCKLYGQQCNSTVLQSPNTIQELGGSAVSRESVNYGSSGSTVLEHPKVCITIRTYAAHKIILPALIGSLENSFTRQEFFNNIHYFIVNTDVKTSFQSQEMIIDTLQKYSFSDRSQATYLMDLQPHSEGDYGYIVTQEALSYQRECDFIMFTNGDNLYNQALFTRLGDALQKDEYDIISFPFVSHHNGEWFLDGKFKHGHIDLGAAIIKMETIVKNDINFYKSMAEEVFSADWYFFEQILQLKNVKRMTMPYILLFHQ